MDKRNRSRRESLIQAVCLLTCMLGCSASVAFASSSSLQLKRSVDEYVQPYLDTGNFSGSVLIAKGDQVLFSGAYGLANLNSETPNEPDTAYYLASTSRIFTSAAILLLEQKGLLSVEDPLSRHIPRWPRGDEITIHHLLTLSAGFPNINSMGGYAAWSSSPQTPESLCARFRDLPLEFEPGTRSVHSNSNYNVLALLIEKISGQTYGEFLRSEFFEPLGMSRTAHDGSSLDIPYRADGYRPVGLAKLEVHKLDQWSVKTGNGSIYSTVEDLYRFDRMLVNDTLLSAASTQKLFTEHFPSNGYGWFLGDRSGSKRVSISGRSPGFGSSWQRLVDPDLTVIVLGNIYNGVPSTIADDLVSLVLGEEIAPPNLTARPPDPQLLSQATGAYKFGPDFYRANATVVFSNQNGHLFNNDSWMIPAGERSFVHRTYWSTITFAPAEAGKAPSVKYDSFTGHHVR